MLNHGGIIKTGERALLVQRYQRSCCIFFKLLALSGHSGVLVPTRFSYREHMRTYEYNQNFHHPNLCGFTHYLEWSLRSGNVMDCHATAQGSNPGRNGVFIELHVLRKGQ